MVSVSNYMYSCIPSPTVTKIFTITQHRPQIKFSKEIDLRLSINLRKLSDDRAIHSVLSKLFK